MRNPNWRRLVFVLLAIGLVVGSVAMFRLRGSAFQWGIFAATMLQLDWAWLAGSLVFIYATYLCRALRWKALLRPLRPEARILPLLSATMIGFTALVLFGRPGEFVRPYLIANKEKVPISSQLAVWLLERVYDLLVVLLLFGFALTRFDQTAMPSGQMGPALRFVFLVGGQVIATSCVACLAVLVLSSLYLRAFTRWVSGGLVWLPVRWQARARSIVDSFVTGMQSTRSAAAVGITLFYTVSEWLIIIASTYCLLRSFPATSELSWLDALIVVGFVAFGGVVQIPGVGGGTQIATTVVLVELYGLPLEVATGISILFWLVTFVSVVPVGLTLAAHEGLNWHKLRHLEEAAQ